MNDIVIQQKEMLSKLENELSSIKIFLVGDTPKDDCCEDTSDKCMLDVMRKNNFALDRCLGLTSMIKEIVKGNER